MDELRIDNPHPGVGGMLIAMRGVQWDQTTITNPILLRNDQGPAGSESPVTAKRQSMAKVSHYLKRLLIT